MFLLSYPGLLTARRTRTCAERCCYAMSDVSCTVQLTTPSSLSSRASRLTSSSTTDSSLQRTLRKYTCTFLTVLLGTRSFDAVSSSRVSCCGRTWLIQSGSTTFRLSWRCLRILYLMMKSYDIVSDVSGSSSDASATSQALRCNSMEGR